jgi:CDK inhibitor PHO81
VDAPQLQDFLRQIINSLAKGRPADAALLAAGISPAIAASNSPNLRHQSESDQQLQLLSEPYNHQTASPENNLKLHKAAFFFKLERELEKVSLRLASFFSVPCHLPRF